MPFLYAWPYFCSILFLFISLSQESQLRNRSIWMQHVILWVARLIGAIWLGSSYMWSKRMVFSGGGLRSSRVNGGSLPGRQEDCRRTFEGHLKCLQRKDCPGCAVDTQVNPFIPSEEVQFTHTSYGWEVALGRMGRSAVPWVWLWPLLTLKREAGMEDVFPYMSSRCSRTKSPCFSAVNQEDKTRIPIILGCWAQGLIYPQMFVNSRVGCGSFGENGWSDRHT